MLIRCSKCMKQKNLTQLLAVDQLQTYMQSYIHTYSNEKEAHEDLIQQADITVYRCVDIYIYKRIHIFKRVLAKKSFY